MSSNYPYRNTFLTQLTSIDVGSNEFPNTLTKMLASQEGEDAATSLRGKDALTLVDILDQTFEAPGMDIDLRRKCVHILRRVCGSQTILPRSCILSDNISKERDITVCPSDGFINTWKGQQDGDRVCVKAFRTHTPEELSNTKQRLFREIVIWRRLSHPNVLPVLGVAPRLSPLSTVTEWMTNGNIMDFISTHPEVNRLRLLAEAAKGLKYLHSMDIIHSDLKPTNILIDNDFHPRLTDYGLTMIVSDPNTAHAGTTTTPSGGTLYCMAPELLNPSSFGLEYSTPTKKSDIYALGMATYQVVTGEQPFPGANNGVIIYNVVNGWRPNYPQEPNEWIFDDVWDFISQSWSPSRDYRPDVSFVMNTLNSAADVAEARRREACDTTGDQGGKATRRVSGTLPSNRDSSWRRIGDLLQDVVRPSPSMSKFSETPSPFVIKVPAGSRTTKKERKKQQQKVFRTWYDSTGFHRQEAALVDYKTGIIHLSSSDGTLLEIPESKLSNEDLTYVRSLSVCAKAQHRARRRLSLALPCFRPPSEPQSRVPDAALLAPRTPTIPTTQLESWEADLVAFFRECRSRIEGSTETEKTLMDYFRPRESGADDNPERKKARRFADRLDSALDSRHLPQRKQTQHLRYLRKLCGTFGILPSSFVLPPRAVKCTTTPFATGGYSEVYKATFKGRPVAVKKLKITATGDHEKVYKLLIREVVGWRWLEHENILPFVGVMFTPPLISIVSALMEYGNIMDFIKKNQTYNRLSLLVGAVTGLKFLHEHEIVHGDLKGANILIDSNRCARVADFGLAVVVEETISNELKGTTRWMAPELMDPEKYGFIGESQKQLPSKSTDMYAIGMTVLEVLTGCRPFSDVNKSVTVICKVMDGNRPERPNSGFTDPLWGLLTETWLDQHFEGPQKRPPVSTVLDLLRGSVDDWDKTIVPVIPKQWEESATDFEEDYFPGVIIPDASQTTSPIPLSHPYDYEKVVRRDQILARIMNKIKNRLGRGA